MLVFPLSVHIEFSVTFPSDPGLFVLGLFCGPRLPHLPLLPEMSWTALCANYQVLFRPNVATASSQEPGGLTETRSALEGGVQQLGRGRGGRGGSTRQLQPFIMHFIFPPISTFFQFTQLVAFFPTLLTISPDPF